MEKIIEHVKSKFEDNYWFEDRLYKESVDEFIISEDRSDDETTSESDTSSDMYQFLYYLPVYFIFVLHLYI